jgi:hypothetical protein
VIIGYNFFGLEHDGTFWDTPVTTEMLDELEINEGQYDEIYINVDTNAVFDDKNKPTHWTLTTILDAKFKGSLDGGSIGADGFNVTQIQLYRSVVGTSKWEAIGQFDYTPDYNVYDYVDRYVQNGAVYRYAIVPKANEVLGDRLESDTIKVVYDGIFVTDKNENRRLEYDIQLGEMSYNTQSAINQPINSQYPIATFGKSQYRSGNLTVLPLSKQTIALDGNGVDKIAEQLNRQEWLDFLNNGKAKVLRMDSGIVMLIVTTNARVTYKDVESLRDLATISFDYTEIGELNFDMLMKNNLIPNGYGHKMTYDENGGIISV